MRSEILKNTIKLQEQNPKIARFLFRGRGHDTTELSGSRHSSTAFNTESQFRVDPDDTKDLDTSTPSRKQKRPREDEDETKRQCCDRSRTKPILEPPKLPPPMSVQICESYASLGLKDLAKLLQFGDPYTDEFNPYRVKPNANV